MQRLSRFRIGGLLATLASSRRHRQRYGCVAACALVLSCSRQEAAPPPPAPAVLVAEVGQQDVPVHSEWVGTTDGYINAQIRAQVSGYLLSKHYRDGATVKAGQLLYQLDPRQYQAALDQALGQLQQARAALLRDQQNVDKYRPLLGVGAVTRQEYDNAVQQVQGDQAAVESAEAAVAAAKLNLGWAKITSPIEGVAGITQSQVGDLIAETTLMTTVSQIDPIKVYFPISEREYLKFSEGIERFRGGDDSDAPVLELILADGTVYPRQGKAAAVNRQVETETGAIQIEALFPNPDNRLRPGGFARIRAVTETRKGALVVPQRAVQEVQGTYQVAVVGSDNMVEIRPVKVGPRQDTLWVIDEGLRAGERVVVEGLQKVKAGLTVQPKPYVAEAGTPATPTPPPAG